MSEQARSAAPDHHLLRDVFLACDLASLAAGLYLIPKTFFAEVEQLSPCSPAAVSTNLGELVSEFAPDRHRTACL